MIGEGRCKAPKPLLEAHAYPAGSAKLRHVRRAVVAELVDAQR